MFCGTSGKIQNDLINAIAEVMGEEMKREINKAPSVAVMVDETTDVSNAAQLALVLRYVTDTGVKERFVRFEDVTSGKRADDITALIVCFLEECECLDKVVAQCYDGAPVMSSGLNGVQAKVKERAPMALFIHCYAHRLNLVLSQGASKLKECKIFFAHLNGLAAFFSRSPRRTQLLNDICQRRLPRVAPTRWQYTWRLVSTVFEKRVALKELFHHILDHHDEYDEDSVRCADGFNARLDDFEFCFLLHTFNGILSIPTCFLQYYRSKHWMYNSVWQGWRSFVTPLSERRADLVRSKKPLRTSQAPRAHGEDQHKETSAHTTNNSTAMFWITFFARYGTDFKTTKN